MKNSNWFLKTFFFKYWLKKQIDSIGTDSIEAALQKAGFTLTKGTDGSRKYTDPDDHNKSITIKSN